MIKKIILISIIISIILLITNISFCFDASLSTDNNIIDINSTIKLSLKISNDKNEKVNIKNIKWIENFDIVWQNQYQSSSSKITIINWKTNAINTTNYTIILYLKAKKSWEYTIWPATIQIWNKIYNTNYLKIKVTWQNIMINNNNNKNNNTSINTNNSYDTNDINKQLKTKSIKINNAKQYNTTLFVIAIMILLWASMIIYVLKDKNIYINNKKQTINVTNIDNKHKSHITINKIKWKLSFLEEYWIENIKTKTYSEILQELNKKNIFLTQEEKDILKNELLYKFKNME